MLTNLHDAFRGQSRSPNIVQFDMLGVVTSDILVLELISVLVFILFSSQNFYFI